MIKKHFLFSTLFFFAVAINSATPEITIIPPYNDINIEYVRTFPFDTTKLGLVGTIKEKFYESFKVQMMKHTNFSKVTMEKPDVYPYYEKTEGTDDWKMASIPPKGHTFKFKGYTPDYILELEDVTYSYGAIERKGMTALRVGLALSGIDSDFDGNPGFYFKFRYYLWDNKNHKVLQCGKLIADEECYYLSKSEWDDLIYEMVEKLFEESGYFVERE